MRIACKGSDFPTGGETTLLTNNNTKTMNATIQKNNRGGWSITPPNSKRAIGNYATPESASAIAKQNGWNPEVK